MTVPGLVFVVVLGTSLAAAAAEPEYKAARTAAAKAALLGAEEAAWAGAQRISWGPAAYETAFRAAWNDAGLFVRFDALDKDPWHTMTRRDDHLWEEEVVEIFLDLDRSGHDYYELEISPGNVVCDVRMISPWPDKKGDFSWDLAGLETSVHMRTDATGKTTGWTATGFLPWAGFRTLPSAKAIALPPKAGDRWRFNLFRVKRPGGKSAPDKDAIEAAWSETGSPSFHVPKAFRDIVFVETR